MSLFLFCALSGGTRRVRNRGQKSFQMLSFDPKTSEFTDFGENYLSFDLGNRDGENGIGLYYSQIDDHMLYTISNEGNHIHVYDLKTMTFGQLGTTIPINVGTRACLASSTRGGRRLYMAGGSTPTGERKGKKEIMRTMNELQVLNLSPIQWLEGVPAMKYRYDMFRTLISTSFQLVFFENLKF